MHRCATRFDAAGGIEKCRRFKEFYDATGSWDRVERIIARVEAGPDGIDTRFIVTSFVGGSGRFIYEKTYCGRGQAENRIKECQLDLFADRTAAATMPANQVRLWFASFADVRLCALRRIGLAFSQFARASCGSIRLKLLKIGALVRVSVRRIHLAMASACPYQHEFAPAHALLRRAGA